MKPRPETTFGSTIEIETGCGTLFVTISEADGYYEVFLRLGKSGGCQSSHLDFEARLITFAWNSGMSLDDIIRAGTGSRCPTPKTLWKGQEKDEVLSCPDAVAKVLRVWKEERNERDSS